MTIDNSDKIVATYLVFLLMSRQTIEAVLPTTEAVLTEPSLLQTFGAEF